MKPTKITSIDLYVISIDGKDERVYLSEGEADAFQRSYLETRPKTEVTFEKRTAEIGGVA